MRSASFVSPARPEPVEACPEPVEGGRRGWPALAGRGWTLVASGWWMEESTNDKEGFSETCPA